MGIFGKTIIARIAMAVASIIIFDCEPGFASDNAQLAVYPRVAGAVAPNKLPDLIYKLLPPVGAENFSWSDRLDNSIVWITNGLQRDGNFSSRIGLTRVRVSNSTSTVLRKSLEELAWSVALEATGNIRGGADHIRVGPGMPDGDDQCFGALYSGCDFLVDDVTNQNRYKASFVCSEGSTDSGTSVYRITSPDKQPMLLYYQVSGGSGGSSSSFELHFDRDASRLCHHSDAKNIDGSSFNINNSFMGPINPSVASSIDVVRGYYEALTQAYEKVARDYLAATLRSNDVYMLSGLTRGSIGPNFRDRLYLTEANVTSENSVTVGYRYRDQKRGFCSNTSKLIMGIHEYIRLIDGISYGNEVCQPPGNLKQNHVESDAMTDCRAPNGAIVIMPRSGCLAINGDVMTDCRAPDGSIVIMSKSDCLAVDGSIGADAHTSEHIQGGLPAR